MKSRQDISRKSIAVNRIGIASAVALGSASNSSPVAAAGQRLADMVLKNGSIYTVDGAGTNMIPLPIRPLKRGY